MNITVDKVLDCKGLACPMPIVKTKKAIETIEAGQVLEVLATDKGSVADIQGWAKNTGHQYLGTLTEGDLFKHYLRKVDPNEVKEEVKYSVTTTNAELADLLASNAETVVLDVREPAEYAFGHLPKAISIPYGELEKRLSELPSDCNIYVICRTGNRSDLACKLLSEKGFSKVINVLPGMSEWTGATETSES